MIRTLGIVCCAVLACYGCGKKEEPVLTGPVGESAPVFGSSDEHKDLNTWIAGKWCEDMGVDAQMAAMTGLPESEEVDDTQYWQFNSDNTFFFTKVDYPTKVHGKWEGSADGIILTYLTWNDEPIQQARARFQQEAESGNSGAIAAELTRSDTLDWLQKMNFLQITEDGKGLVFTQPHQGDSGGGFLLAMDTPLVRMK